MRERGHGQVPALEMARDAGTVTNVRGSWAPSSPQSRILLQVFPQLGRLPLDPRDLPPQDHDIGQAVIRNGVAGGLDDLIGYPGLCQEDFRREDTDVLGDAATVTAVSQLPRS